MFDIHHQEYIFIEAYSDMHTNRELNYLSNMISTNFIHSHKTWLEHLLTKSKL